MFLNAGLLIESVFKFYIWSRVVQRGVLKLGLLCNDRYIYQAVIKQLPNLPVCTCILSPAVSICRPLHKKAISWTDHLKYCVLIYTCNCLSYMGGMRNFRGLSQVLIGLSRRERIYRLNQSYSGLNFPIKNLVNYLQISLFFHVCYLLFR